MRITLGLDGPTSAIVRLVLGTSQGDDAHGLQQPREQRVLEQCGFRRQQNATVDCDTDEQGIDQGVRMIRHDEQRPIMGDAFAALHRHVSVIPT
jgi:hypothetical protein